MNVQQRIKLILKSKEFYIPISFCSINDIDQDIYNQLTTNLQYVVKSDVSEEVFESFINHWVNKELPKINSDNISQYEKLSQEFDRMKDVIQLMRKYIPSNDSFSLEFQNRDLIKKDQEKKDQLEQKSKKYHQIIEILFSNNEQTTQFLQIKDDLSNLIKEEEIELIELLTKKAFNSDDGLTYSINDKKLICTLYSCFKASNDVLIPSSIFINSKEYKITTIGKNCFQFAYKIKSIQFSNNSNLQAINENAFYDSSLESLTIPSSVSEFKEGWCSGVNYLNNIKINDEKEINIKYFNDQLILKKSDIKSNVFDHLIFARRDIETVTIPPYITNISPYSFQNCLKLRILEFSVDSKLLMINNFAFSNTSIENISIPSNVVKIGKQAFSECKKLKTIEFGKNSRLNSIEEFAFQKSSLENLSIPSCVSELKEGWCRGVKYLKNITIHKEKVENISYFNNQFIFGKSDIKSDIFDVLIFARRDIKTALIPSFIKHISQYAFSECQRLQKVEFSNDSKLRIIDNKAFSNSSIESIIIPPSVTIIGSGAFSNCQNLSAITFSENSELFSIGEDAFYNSALISLKIPSHVTAIKSSTFSTCEQLEKVEFSDNSKLNKIYRSSFSYSSINCIVIPSHVKEIGKYAFNKCDQLRNVEFSKNSKLKLIGKHAFSDSSLENLSIPANVIQIGNLAFDNCSQLRKIECSNNSKLRIIGKKAFSSSPIDTLSIPSCVEVFQEGWCFNTINLAKISIIPAKKKNIFYFDNKFIIGKTNLNSNNFDLLIFAQRCIENAIIPSYISKISSYSFDRCTILKTIEFSNNSKLKEIGNNAFSYTIIKNIKIPPKVKKIGQNAFYSCMHLNSIEFSNDSELRIIEQYTFLKSSIEFIKIPSSVVKIDEYAFNECRNLKKVEFEKNSNLKTIESLAFADSSIESIKIPSKVLKIGDYAFSFCSQLKKVEFSHKSELRLIGNGAFYKSAIEHFQIPIHVMHIGEVTFSGCKKLKNIEIENHSELISIEKSAFDESSLIITSIPSKLKKLLHLNY